MQGAATKCADDTKLLVEKEGGKAALAANLQTARTERATKRAGETRGDPNQWVRQRREG